MNDLIIYTDGAVNQLDEHGSIGTWAFIILHEGKVFSHAMKNELNFTVANSELTAIIKALQQVNHLIKGRYLPNKKIKLYSDSAFAVTSLNSSIKNWKRNATTDGKWKKSNGESVVNQEEFTLIDNLCQNLDIDFIHVKAHDTNIYNNLVDQLCTIGYRSLKNSIDINNNSVDILNSYIDSKCIEFKIKDTICLMNLINRKVNGSDLTIQLTSIENSNKNKIFTFDNKEDELNANTIRKIMDTSLSTVKDGLVHLNIYSKHSNPNVSLIYYPDSVSIIENQLKKKNFLN